MLNKKRILGAGLIIAGGAIAGIGGVILKKTFSKTEDSTSIAACGKEECEDCGYCEHYMNENNFKEDIYKVEPKCNYEEDIDTEEIDSVSNVENVGSAYNPLTEPKSLSQEELEAHGDSTF